MGHIALQRVVVRMLYDDSFAEAAHADPDVLARAGLAPEERAQVLSVDRRAWRTDPLRRRRTLRILADEFKASTTLALAETRSLASLEGYFSSPQFHNAVQERRSIALAFGDFLAAAVEAGRLATPQLRDVVRLETAMARCRRDARARPPIPPGTVRLAAGVAVGAFEANVISTIQRAEQYLFEVGLMPAVALCADAPALGDLPPVRAETIHLLLTTAGGHVSLSYLDAATFEILSVAASPAGRAELTELLVRRGVPAAAAGETLDALVAEGILAAHSGEV